MSARKNSAKIVSFRDTANAFDVDMVNAMSESIDACFDKRNEFESVNGGLGGSYLASRKLMLENKTSVARFFLALNVSASSVICRQVVEGKMFNAKALKKIVELARFTVSGSDKIEMVTKAFLACAIVSNRSGFEVIPNIVNKAFISNLELTEKMVNSEELREALQQYRGKTVTGGRDTQSSQIRNVLDVLNIGAIVSSDTHSRGAIKVNADNGLVKLFEERFMIAA